MYEEVNTFKKYENMATFGLFQARSEVGGRMTRLVTTPLTSKFFKPVWDKPTSRLITHSAPGL